MKFVKYQGTGNDFILIFDNQKQLLSDQISTLCDRRYGIGADGLIFVRNNPNADAAITIFNADGSSAKMCGNGLRCVVQSLADSGRKKKDLVITVGEKKYVASIKDKQVIVDMGVPTIFKERIMNGRTYFYIDSGVPHFVHFCEDMHRKDFVQIARSVRNHKDFSPSGVNVNFVKLLSAGLLHIRTYERGVEAETLSCGTGAAAACVAAWKKYGAKGKIEVEFASKERLQFDLLAAGKLMKKLMMKGRAVRVYQGEVEI